MEDGGWRMEVEVKVTRYLVLVRVRVQGPSHPQRVHAAALSEDAASVFPRYPLAGFSRRSSQLPDLDPSSN